MEKVKAYLTIIDTRLLHHISGKPGAFIDLLREQKWASEEAFIQAVCGEKHSRQYYKNLESRTLQILQSLSIMSTSRGGSDVKKKYDDCLKKFTIGQKFLNKGVWKEGIRIIKQAHRIAGTYDFVHIASETSSILHHNYVYYEPNKRQATDYAELMEKYLSAYTAEKIAKSYFHTTLASGVDEALYTKRLREALQKMSELKGCSLQFKFYEFRLQVLLAYQNCNYKVVVEKCKEALSFFQNKKGVYSSSYQFLFQTLGTAQMALAQYPAAEASLAHAAQFAPARSKNDYILRLYTTLNYLHSKQYHQAYELYRRNTKCPFADVREQFILIEAYMCFLAHEGYFKLDKVFRLGKYLNETFKAQTDKQGSNVSILIAELLVYLVRDRDKFIDRVELVRKYSYQYLRGEATRRAKLFIRILSMMPRANFHPKTLQKVAKKQIDDLLNLPIHMGNNVIIEIVPFHDLINMITRKTKAKGRVA